MSQFVMHARTPLAGTFAVMLLAAAMWLAPAHAAGSASLADYPSWDEVEQAKQTEAGKAAEIGRINALLDDLQGRSQTLGTEAVESAAEHALAETALLAATVEAEALAVEAARVDAELAGHRKALGAMAAQSYRTGGTNMGFFIAFDAVESNSVHGLNVMQIVSDKTAGLVTKAAAAAKAAASLAEQEREVRKERELLAREAETTLGAARIAQDSVARQIGEEQQRTGELTAQLASLKGTTAALETEYRQGRAALAAYEASQAAKRAAADEQARRQADEAGTAAPVLPPEVPAAPAPAPVDPEPAAPALPVPVNPPAAPEPVTPPSPPPVVVPSIPGGAVNDPAAAKSYASGRLGAYGWDQDQFLCLARLWTKESNWLTTATNPYSGAYGIAQALPASKYASAGSDWLTSYRTQIEWGLGYIQERYRSPCAAWNHSVAKNWY